MLVTILPLVLIFVVFYFLLIRPQQKKMKEHKALVANLKRGDRVVTSGGLIGTVARVLDEEIEVEIAQGVKAKVVRSMVSTVVSKTDVAARKKAEKADDKAAEPEDEAKS
ncbi:preprotein translocase subunit YajC [Tistlia consotensis]|uniref:Sec translocon accessory complex subunit YajC n=2 Tax=Tistlia TaxID=1321364 RepID=A0A1Y6CN95_9PROT|nr:protein translocase subunit yajC [Tistlia consotensis USBA 355]SNS13548.1 preprotein translocase subunit YajC [Tistlia consotensis]